MNDQSVAVEDEHKAPAYGIALVVLMSFLLLAVGAWWYYLGYVAVSNEEAQMFDYTTVTPFSVLMAQNDDFAEAERLMRLQEYDAALAAYERALSLATDATQKTQIRFKIANVYEREGDYVRAIQLFKALVADPVAYPLAKAYATQRLGTIFYTHGYGRPEISAEVFAGEPYASMIREGDEQLAYRRIFEYASTFFPLAVAEMRIADWYANDLRRQDNQDKLSDDTKQTYTAIIAERLRNADADVARTRGDANANGLIPSVLIRKGEVIKKLAVLQIPGYTLEDAEEAFRSALELQGILGITRGEDGFARLHYAQFLVEVYGDERLEDANTLLTPFYERPDLVDTAVSNFLTQAKSQNSKKNIVEMGNQLPLFKSYLTNIGWSETDFVL